MTVVAATVVVAPNCVVVLTMSEETYSYPSGQVSVALTEDDRMLVLFVIVGIMFVLLVMDVEFVVETARMTVEGTIVTEYMEVFKACVTVDMINVDVAIQFIRVEFLLANADDSTEDPNELSLGLVLLGALDICELAFKDDILAMEGLTPHAVSPNISNSLIHIGGYQCCLQQVMRLGRSIDYLMEICDDSAASFNISLLRFR